MKITDVSTLGNLHTLDLAHTKVTNVSVLDNIHTFGLEYCKNIV